MRITLLIPSLQAGGAERVLSGMANYWAANGWAVSIVTLVGAQPPPFYPLRPHVQHLALDVAAPSSGTAHAAQQNIARVAAVRAALRHTQPQVVISFIDQMNVLTLLAMPGLGVPVIVSERVDPSQHPIGRSWALLRTWLYPRADRIVVLTSNVVNYFPASMRRRIRVIPNPVAAPNMDAVGDRPARRNKDGYTIMALGRLAEQKGFDMLLHAFAQIAPRHPHWSLTIWGEGEQRAALEALARRLGICARVRFPGVTRQPFDAMRQSDLFVLSSRYEGFPNALCEAMACGLPVISFDCPSGPRDIIRDGVDGVLAPAMNVAALAAAMDRLLSNAAERQRLAQHAPDVLERFGVEAVMAQWEALIHEVCHANPPVTV